MARNHWFRQAKVAYKNTHPCFSEGVFWMTSTPSAPWLVSSLGSLVIFLFSYVSAPVQLAWEGSNKLELTISPWLLLSLWCFQILSCLHVGFLSANNYLKFNQTVTCKLQVSVGLDTIVFRWRKLRDEERDPWRMGREDEWNRRSRAEFSNHGGGAAQSPSLEQASSGTQTLSLFKHGRVLESF